MMHILPIDPLADEHIYSLVFKEERDKDFKKLLTIFKLEGMTKR